MRCLTLADELRRRGHACIFASATLGEDLQGRVTARGHDVVVLPNNGVVPHGTETVWPDALQVRDASAVLAALGPTPNDWMVVDHYGLDRTWHELVRRHAGRLMVIDDLANRSYDCDLLLDQNLGRSEADYAGLVGPGTKVIAGPQFALLRPEFAAARARCVPRAEPAGPVRLMISFGGADPHDYTGRVLRELSCMDLPPDMEISVVLGALARYVDEVRALAASMPRPTEILTNVDDMAALMSRCDVAIGAAGATAWERCCLGLPSVIMVIAENQRPGATALAKAGAARMATMDEIAAFDMTTFFDASDGRSAARIMSDTAAEVCDGLGAARVSEALRG